MKNKFILIIMILSGLTLSCQSNKIKYCNGENLIINEYDYENLNKEWVRKDTIFIKKLLKKIHYNSAGINTLINPSSKDRNKLEKSYFLSKGAYGRGYTSVFYEFVYKNDKLIGYKLTLKTEDFLLFEKLGLRVSDFFNEEKRGYYSFHYNLSEVFTGKNSNLDVRDKIIYYMTPFSGITYGCKGGYGDVMLENRCAFKQIENTLTKKDVFYLLESLNPASKLTAIEYYYKNKDKFNIIEQEELDVLIDNIFNELEDGIEVFKGDIILKINPREALKRQMKKEC